MVCITPLGVKNTVWRGNHTTLCINAVMCSALCPLCVVGRERQMAGKSVLQAVSLDRNLSLQGMGGAGGGKKTGGGGEDGGIFSRSPLRALLRKTGQHVGVVLPPPCFSGF